MAYSDSMISFEFATFDPCKLTELTGIIMTRSKFSGFDPTIRSTCIFGLSRSEFLGFDANKPLLT